MKNKMKGSKISIGLLLISISLLIIAHSTKLLKSGFSRRALKEYGIDFFDMSDYEVVLFWIPLPYDTVFTILILLIALSVYLIIYKNDTEIKSFCYSKGNRILNTFKKSINFLNDRKRTFLKKRIFNRGKKNIIKKEYIDSAKVFYSEPIKRVFAFGIDFLILFFVTSFIWKVFYIPIPIGSKEILSGSLTIFKHPILIIVHWFYYAFFESSKLMATPGKRIVQIRVTNKDYEKLSFLQGTIRYFSKLLSALVLFFGFIMIAFTKKNQGLHDIISETYVVKGNSDLKRGKILIWCILISSLVLYVSTKHLPSNMENIELLNRAYEKLNKSKLNNIYYYYNTQFTASTDWEVKKEEIEKGYHFKIDCYNNLSNSFMSITLVNDSVNIENWLNLQKVELNANLIPEGIQPVFKQIKTTKFLNNNALSSEYAMSNNGNSYFGRIIAFYTKGRTIMVIQQTNSFNKLLNEFKDIENSIKIK